MSDPIREIAGVQYVYLDYHEEALKAERTKREEAEMALSAERERADNLAHAHLEAELDWKKKNEALESNLKENAISGQATMEEAYAKITALEAKVKELESDDYVSVLGEKINDLIESRKADDAKIADLESQLASEKEIRKTQEQMADVLRTSLATANAKIAELEAQIDTWGADKQTYIRRIHALESQLSATRSMGYWQKCPKCDAQGVVSKPPGLAGDVTEWASSSISHTCDVCNGAKIIAVPDVTHSITNMADESDL